MATSKDYVQKQAQWVSDNSLEVGSTVRIVRLATSWEQGWANTWSDEMSAQLGKEYKILRICETTGIELADGVYELQYPYFALEPVKVKAAATPDSPNFKVGQKLICKDVSYGGAGSLTLGKMYTVARTANDTKPQFVYLQDTDTGRSDIAWWSKRFEAAPEAISETAPATEEKAYETALRCLAPLVINQICEKTHASNVKAGWWDQADNPLVVPTKIALIVSECAEALEGHRRGLKDDKLPQYDMIAVELADVLIRVFDLAGFLKIPLGTIIADKEVFNASRTDHKPENRAAKGGKKY